MFKLSNNIRFLLKYNYQQQRLYDTYKNFKKPEYYDPDVLNQFHDYTKTHKNVFDKVNSI